jgi:hypothetical protein
VGPDEADPLTPRRWTRAEYDRLVNRGVLHGKPVELVGASSLSPSPRAATTPARSALPGDALRAALPYGWLVRIQMRSALDDESEPEPDVAVVPGTWAGYRREPPVAPALVVEVAESSLAFDREDKGSLYARGGVRDYWILNLVDRALEVIHDPAPDPAAPYGWRLRTVEWLGPAAAVSRSRCRPCRSRRARSCRERSPRLLPLELSDAIDGLLPFVEHRSTRGATRESCSPTARS